MRDAPVRRLPVVSDMGHLVGALSIDNLVLVAQSVRAGADPASVVGFHAVGRVERRGRGVGSLSRFRDGVDHLFVAALVASGVRRAGINATRKTGRCAVLGRRVVTASRRRPACRGTTAR